MSEQVRHLYEFGPFRLDATERLLLRDQQHIPLSPKAFDTLLVLVEHGGHVVDKTELMKKVWPDTFVEEVNLAKNVSCLRKVLGSEHSEHYIETIPKRGYRFVAGVREVWAEETSAILADHKTLSPHVTADRTRENGTNVAAQPNGKPSFVAATSIEAKSFETHSPLRHSPVRRFILPLIFLV